MPPEYIGRADAAKRSIVVAISEVSAASTVNVCFKAENAQSLELASKTWEKISSKPINKYLKASVKSFADKHASALVVPAAPEAPVAAAPAALVPSEAPGGIGA